MTPENVIKVAELVCLGASLGFFGGLFGIGGGIIAVPVLVLAFDMQQAPAQGTTLSMMVPILALGLWRYSRKHPIPFPGALYIALVASVTTYLVAMIANRLDSGTLRVLFGIFLAVLSLEMIAFKRNVGLSERKSLIPHRMMPLVGVLGGTSMGLLGIGGGLVATPLLTMLFAQRQAVAQSISMALVTPCAVVALLTYNHAGSVDWSIGLPLALGGLTTVSAGVAVAHSMPERKMRILFGVMLLLTAGTLLFKHPHAKWKRPETLKLDSQQVHHDVPSHP
jgi:uncharacterized membrane protein YfcA